MKRRFIHLQLTFVFACMLLFALTICSYAAEGFEGYAVYRDGAFLGTTWHGGLMDGAHPKKEKPPRSRYLQGGFSFSWTYGPSAIR